MLQLANLIRHSAGKIGVYTNKLDVEVTAGNNKLDINFVNKEFIKEILDFLPKGKEGINLRSSLGALKNVADEFHAGGVTVTFSYKHDTLIAIGVEAKPKLTQFFTGKSIEITNLPKLIRLALQLRT